MENYILSYKDVTLFKCDVETILEPRYINDKIIMFFFEFAMNDDSLESYNSDESITYIHPNVSFLCRTLDIESAALIVEDLHLDEKEHIFIPCPSLDGISHWSLIYVNRKDGLMYHYDSMGELNFNIALETVRSLEKSLNLPILSAKNPLRRMDCPQQKNSYDCGIYVCAFFRALLWQIIEEKRNNYDTSMKYSSDDEAKYSIQDSEAFNMYCNNLRKHLKELIFEMSRNPVQNKK